MRAVAHTYWYVMQYDAVVTKGVIDSLDYITTTHPSLLFMYPKQGL